MNSKKLQNTDRYPFECAPLGADEYMGVYIGRKIPQDIQLETAQKPKALCCGWDSPTGELIPCSRYDHLEKAREIVKKLGIDATIHPDDILLRRKWAYVSRSDFGHREWMIAWWSFLTEEQKNTLRPYFEVEADVNSFSLGNWKAETAAE